MLWQILINTQLSRRTMLSQLMSLLEPQLVPQVGILIHEDVPGDDRGIGDKREELRQKATGEYISFLDSDDFIPPYFVETVLPLLDGVDTIGWEQEVWHQGAKIPKRDFHTITVPGWWDEDTAFHRDISLGRPMRRDLAMQKPISGGYGEDHRWADAMRGLVKTEHYIDKVMYFYLWRSVKDDAKDALDPWRISFLDSLRS